jgi:hypothetical protein
VSSGEEVFTARDVIVGEVWIGSGQSNMEWTVGRTAAAADAKSRPADAGLRVFTVARKPMAEPVEDVQGYWKLAAPDTVESFTATGFYFARELRANLKQPVGVIHTSIGGTRAEAWGPKGMYADVPEAKGFEDKEAAAMKARAANLEKLQARLKSEKDKAVAAKLRQDAAKLAPVWSNGPHMNWNGMVAPLVGYSVRGALWYQGESNAGQPEAYKWVLGSMIKSWHKAWGQEFPFLIVQLPRFMARKPELAVEEGWPAIRESMEWIADNVPGAMMSVNIDLGEGEGHPSEGQASRRRTSRLRGVAARLQGSRGRRSSAREEGRTPGRRLRAHLRPSGRAQERRQGFRPARRRRQVGLRAGQGRRQDRHGLRRQGSPRKCVMLGPTSRKSASIPLAPTACPPALTAAASKACLPRSFADETSGIPEVSLLTDSRGG